MPVYVKIVMSDRNLRGKIYDRTVKRTDRKCAYKNCWGL